VLKPTTVPDVQFAVRQHPRLLPRGGGTKPALSTAADGVPTLDLSGLSGVLEYEPAEFTFTALSGTPVSVVRDLLSRQGQYLPFDPPLVERGATLGGTVAAGLSGPGRCRYGGVRDFILGVRFVEGSGELVRGGAKVVKNAAGFDFPKLMVGSLGNLGVLVELSFKVFPLPSAHVSVQRTFASMEEAVEALRRVYTSPLDMDALDLVTEEDGRASLWLRLAGMPEALAQRADHVCELLGGGDRREGEPEEGFWTEAREFSWVPATWTLVKVPLTPARISIAETLRGVSPIRRYSAAGNVGWLATPESPQALDTALRSAGLSGLTIFGPPGKARLGVRTGEAFERRVKSVLDPSGKFGEV
jgi:glycolate oxidase FAD binding subunit